MKFFIFSTFVLLFVSGPIEAKLEDYLKHTEQNQPSQDQIIYVERLGDSFTRYVQIENNEVSLDEDEADIFMEDYEASQTLTQMFNSLNGSTLDNALEVGNVVSTFMASVLKDYSSSVKDLTYDYDKKVIIQVMWWLKQEGQGAVSKKLAALNELKSKGSVSKESSKTAEDMDKACIKNWGMYSAYYHKFDVDQPESSWISCYNASGSRSEAELYNVDLLTTLFTDMVSVQEPKCGHVDYAVSFPKGYLAGMKWVLRVFSGFQEPDTNEKIKKAGEHIGALAEKAIEKYKKHDIKGYQTELKKANEKLQQILTDLDKCMEKEKSREEESMTDDGSGDDYDRESEAGMTESDDGMSEGGASSGVAEETLPRVARDVRIRV